MNDSKRQDNAKVALITGAAKRIGAAITRKLHSSGYKVIIHCNESTNEAAKLAEHLNRLKPDSAQVIQQVLSYTSELEKFAEDCTRFFQRLDVVVNNASVFLPTPLQSLNPDEFDDLVNINLKAPLFLAQHFAPALRKQRGCIVNLIDIHGEKPLKEYLAYSVSKAGLIMLTKALAVELAPSIRVNGISPGAILWPEDTAELNELQKQSLLDRIPAGRLGTLEAIAKGVLYLVRDAEFVTGQVISIDGGQSIA